MSIPPVNPSNTAPISSNHTPPITPAVNADLEAMQAFMVHGTLPPSPYTNPTIAQVEKSLTQLMTQLQADMQTMYHNHINPDVEQYFSLLNQGLSSQVMSTLLASYPASTHWNQNIETQFRQLCQQPSKFDPETFPRTIYGHFVDLFNTLHGVGS